MPDVCSLQKNFLLQLQMKSSMFCPQVFHLHLILGIQDLLCVWLHVTGVPDPHGGGDVRDYCVCLFLTQCWGLQVAVDKFLSSSLHFCLCLRLCHILLLLQNQVRTDIVLLKLYMYLKCHFPHYCACEAGRIFPEYIGTSPFLYLIIKHPPCSRLVLRLKELTE